MAAPRVRPFTRVVQVRAQATATKAKVDAYVNEVKVSEAMVLEAVARAQDEVREQAPRSERILLACLSLQGPKDTLEYRLFFKQGCEWTQGRAQPSQTLPALNWPARTHNSKIP